MDLLPYFQWLEATWLGETIRQSRWLFPVIEAVHLLGLCVLGGAVLVVDLRMLGLGLRHQPVSHILNDARPWLIGSLGVMLTTGGALLASEAIKCYYTTSFWVKMTALPVAIVFAFLIRDRAASRAVDVNARTKAVALVSIALWLTVAAAGRWIGFSS